MASLLPLAAVVCALTAFAQSPAEGWCLKANALCSEKSSPKPSKTTTNPSASIPHFGGPGRPTGEAFVNFTTSTHAEAYVDAAWVGRRGLPHADFESILPGTAKQAGEVTAFKLAHATAKSPAGNPDYLKFQEGCRTLVKDFNTKLIGSPTGAIHPQAPLAKADPRVQQQVLKLRSTMEAFARNEIGPIEANRAIRELTGGDSLPAALKLYESLLVAGSK